MERSRQLKLARDLACRIAETMDFSKMSELNELCVKYDIFMQEDEDRIWIEDDCFLYVQD